jgi:hypothetical protein
MGTNSPPSSEAFGGEDALSGSHPAPDTINTMDQGRKKSRHTKRTITSATWSIEEKRTLWYHHCAARHPSFPVKGCSDRMMQLLVETDLTEKVKNTTAQKINNIISTISRNISKEELEMIQRQALKDTSMNQSGTSTMSKEQRRKYWTQEQKKALTLCKLTSELVDISQNKRGDVLLEIFRK